MISLSDLMPEPTAAELEAQFQSCMQRQQAEEQQTYVGTLQDGTRIALTIPKKF